MDIRKTAAELCRIDDNEGINASAKFMGLEALVVDATEHMLVGLFPYHLGKPEANFDPERRRTLELTQAEDSLSKAIEAVVEDKNLAADYAVEVIEALPEILRVLNTDIEAAYEGDPAAMSTDEVILTYPAFKAISIYRIAHELYEMGIKVIPRSMTEYAHRITGIDIHPGATIGKSFFIDHGTGVVIGETTTIGEHVKLYQHVTLGAKSFEVNEDGTLVKGIKRHPDIGNNVVIYAGATILGGNTHIGDDCVIGGNVWLTHSVEPGQKVTI